MLMSNDEYGNMLGTLRDEGDSGNLPVMTRGVGVNDMKRGVVQVLQAIHVAKMEAERDNCRSDLASCNAHLEVQTNIHCVPYHLPE